jgi:imidazolonepropionase-like amidohydrolase
MTPSTHAAALLLLAAAAAAAGPAARAADWKPNVHALVGVRIVTEPGKVIESGTVVMRDGVVEAVGAENAVAAPPDARVWRVEDVELTVYPGLIEPYSVRSWPEPKEKDKAPQGGHANPLVRPERDMTLHAGDDTAAKKLREAGYTTAVAAPKEGLFRGTSVVLNLGDGSVERNLLRAGWAQNVTLKPMGRGGDDGARYPASVMGAVALFRQVLLDTSWYGAAQAAYRRRPAQKRPEFSTAYAALEAAAAGRQPVVIETENVLDTLRAAALARELRLTAHLVGNGEEYKRLAEVRASGLPHLLPLAFPKPPQPAAKTGADPPDPIDPPDLNIELDALREWDLAPGNPKQLIDSGLPVAFTTHRLDDPKKIHESLARAMERGLGADEALAAMTTVPARLLGLADRLGTIAPGKLANLVVVEGELLVAKPKIREVWIDGERYEVKESKPPEAQPAGTWELTLTTGDGQQIPVTLELAGDAASLSGTVAAMGASTAVSSASVSGKKLEIEFEGSAFGFPGAIQFTLEITGETCAGSGSSPAGPFTLSGNRTKKPASEVSR